MSTEVSVRALRDAAKDATARGHVGAALEALGALHDRHPEQTNFVARALRALADASGFGSSLLLHVLRTGTFEPLVPHVVVAAGIHGVIPSVTLGDFSVVDVALRSPDADAALEGAAVVLVATRLADFVDRADPESVQKARSRAVELATSLRVFRRRSTATVLVTGVRERAGDDDPGSAASAFDDALAAELATIPSTALVDLATSFEAARGSPIDEARAKETGFAYTPEGARRFASALARHLVPVGGRRAKVVVSDLDGTLWHGVLGEDGADGIVVTAAHRAYQLALREAAARGAMLAIASKNDASHALDVLGTHPQCVVRPPDFATTRIGWGSKATALREIAAELHVGVDTLLFVDDHPLERAEVKRALPGVHVLSWPDSVEGLAEALLMHPALPSGRTAEDAGRADLVRADVARSRAEAESESPETFLASLDLRLLREELDASNLGRAAQLTQKTNQFNLTTRRRNEAALEAFAEGGGLVRLYRVVDRFGDHGLVGLALVTVDGEVAELDTFLMSCRVLGRSAETAMLADLVERLRAVGVTRLRASYVPTERNGPCRMMLPLHGFRLLDEDDRGTWYEASLEDVPEAPPWFAGRDALGKSP